MRSGWRWSSILWASVAACGLLGGGDPGAPAPEPERKSVFLPPDDLGAGAATERVLAQEDRERMAFIGAAADLQVQWTVDGAPSTHRVKFEQIAMRVADVPSMLFPIGHLKVDPISWSVEPQAGWAEHLKRYFFRDPAGAPIQVFFDIQTVGKLDGRLDRDGASAVGQVVGALQVDSRQAVLAFNARFTRPSKGRLIIETVEPVPVPIAEFQRDAELAAAMKAIGAAAWEPTVTLTARVEFTEASLDSLPTFIRVPVTEQTMTELQERLDADVDDYDALQYKLDRQGMSEESRQAITRERFERMREVIKKHEAEPEETPINEQP